MSKKFLLILTTSSPFSLNDSSIRQTSAGSVIQETPQLPAPTGVLELAQCLRLDLADAFAGDRELLADFFQGVVGVHADAEAHAQDAFFARG